MVIVITTISIFAITIIVWLANRMLPFKICPICAGVSATWLWMLVGMFSGQLPATDYQLLTAILMGGTVVGIVYQIEKRPAFAQASADAKALADKSAGKLLLWKTIFISAGFIAAYSVLTQWWAIFLVSLALLLLISFLFFHPSNSRAISKKMIAAPSGRASPNAMRRDELEKKMEDCC